jgi:hypothetical protein
VKLIITIEVPEGAHIATEDAATKYVSTHGPDLEPGELESLAEVAPGATTNTAAPVPQPHPICPTHRDSHLVPAGTSSKTGAKYKPFWGCTDRDCTWRQNA